MNDQLSVEQLEQHWRIAGEAVAIARSHCGLQSQEWDFAVKLEEKIRQKLVAAKARLEAPRLERAARQIIEAATQLDESLWGSPWLTGSAIGDLRMAVQDYKAAIRKASV